MLVARAPARDRCLLVHRRMGRRRPGWHTGGLRSGRGGLTGARAGGARVVATLTPIPLRYAVQEVEVEVAPRGRWMRRGVSGPGVRRRLAA